MVKKVDGEIQGSTLELPSKLLLECDRGKWNF